MFRKMTLTDIKKNKLITCLLIMFIVVASSLLSCATGLIIQLTGSIQILMEDARTPDFMQMHSGEIDLDRLKKFASTNKNIEKYQVLEFLNIEGTDIFFGEKSLSDSMIDNGFSVQSPYFDYLLNLEGNVIQVVEGEVYIPISYMEEYKVHIGDTLTVCGIPLKIAGALRDSQMNSSLASSKRFLINKVDYEKLVSHGREEYLIEFKGHSSKDANAIESAYTQAGLESNGPAITYSLFYLINAMSDGILIAMIILMSVLIVLIAFLCIRFTLLAKLEDDYREIGIMKAIGMNDKEIKSLYLKKYIYIAAMGCLVGYIISFGIKQILIRNISLYMGQGGNNVLSGLAGLLGTLLLYLWIAGYAKNVLKRIKQVSIVSAIREGKPTETGKYGNGICLLSSGWMNPNIFMGIKDVLNRKKLYLTMLLVLIMSVFIIIVPQNMYQTISSDSFVSFMGVGKCDARIDLQQLEDIGLKAEEVKNWLEQDDDVEEYGMYVTRSYPTKLSDGTIQNMKIEVGDYEKFTIDYIEGSEPESEKEIALSYLNAKELGKKVGDTIPVLIEDNWIDLTVCGIYSDITNGGKTAKAKFTDASTDAMWYVFCIDYKDGISVNEKTVAYKDSFEYGKVAEVKEYIYQTLGSTIESLKMISKIAVILALTIVILITSLFMKMLIAKDSYSISVMRSLGFSKRDIAMQYATRAVIILLISISLGTVLSNTVGVLIAGMALAGLGVAKFHFVIKPLLVCGLYPVLLLSVVIFTSLISTRTSGKISIIEHIQE